MNTEKHIKVTGYSNISWKDAIIKTVETASQSLENLSTLKILEQKARINNNKIVEYMVDLDISFFVDSSKNTSSANNTNN